MEGPAEPFRVRDQVIGRHDDHGGAGPPMVDDEGGQDDGGRGIAPDRLENHVR
jgi:hypothetical protein